MAIRKRIAIVGTVYKILPPHIAGSKRKAFTAHFRHKGATISMYLQPNQATFSSTEIQILALCKKKILRHIKFAVYAWSTKC